MDLERKIEIANIAKELTISLLKEKSFTSSDINNEKLVELTCGTFNQIFSNVYDEIASA